MRILTLTLQYGQGQIWIEPCVKAMRFQRAGYPADFTESGIPRAGEDGIPAG